MHRSKKSSVAFALVTGCVALGVPMSAFAADATWKAAPVDSAWQNGANWSSGAAPGDTLGPNSFSTDVANLPVSGSAITTIIPDAGRAISSVQYTGGWSGTTNYVIGAAGGPALYLNSNMQLGPATVTFNIPVIINDNAFFQPYGVGCVLNYNGGVTSSLPSVRYNWTMLNANGIANFNAPITGNLRIYANGGNATSEYNLNVANTFTGGSMFDQTVVKVRFNATGAFPGGDLMLQRGGYVEGNALNAITGNTIATIGDFWYTNESPSIAHFNYANDYTGGTTVNRTTAELWVHNATGSATGTGNVNVKGLLAGAGQIINTGTNGVTLLAMNQPVDTINDPAHFQPAGVYYARLAPGDTPGAVGNLRLDLGSAGLNIAAAVNGWVAGAPANGPGVHNMMFDLGTTAASDKVSLLGHHGADHRRRCSPVRRLRLHAHQRHNRRHLHAVRQQHGDQRHPGCRRWRHPRHQPTSRHIGHLRRRAGPVGDCGA